jgi:hypothetical protein
LLDEVNPDKVVFSGLESYYEIALNIACRNRNIKTYFLQHGGPMQNLDFYKIAFSHTKNEFEDQGKQNFLQKFHATLFYFRGVKLNNLSSFHKILRYYLSRQTSGNYMKILEQIQFDLRKPDYYIECTFHNASWIRQRDKITDNSRILEIGVMSLDPYFRKDQPQDQKDFYLLIDSPLELFPSLHIDQEKHFVLYSRLNRLALKNNSRLLIKLHPKNYNTAQLPQHENITYIRDKNISEEIREAKACFCFYSTLALPAIYFSNCNMIRLDEESPVQQEWEKLGVVNCIDIKDVLDDNYELTMKPVNKQNMEKFVSLFLYRTDGKATERLKNILLS